MIHLPAFRIIDTDSGSESVIAIGFGNRYAQSLPSIGTEYMTAVSVGLFWVCFMIFQQDIFLIYGNYPPADRWQISCRKYDGSVVHVKPQIY